MTGGKGERLYPLTRDRSKPAVPFGGIYRIIDFTLSNCINSGLRRLCILTQHRSFSLQRHLELGWNIFRRELGEFMDILPAQQRMGEHFYTGTADAVYQNIYSIQRDRPSIVLILAGDHIYKMDYSLMLQFHEEKKAALTVGAVEVRREKAKGLGVMEVDGEARIIGFQEKPDEPAPIPNNPDFCLASMGIYVFDTPALVRELFADAKSDSEHDFGKNIIPSMIPSDRVFAYNFRDPNRNEANYWRDIGTMEAFYEANMDLVSVSPQLNLYDTEWPIRTYQEPCPPAKTVFSEKGRTGMAIDSIVSGGTIISGGSVKRSILSPRVRVNSHAEVEDSILMEGVTIGRGCRIRKAIIDKRVNVPAGTEIGYNLEEDRKRFTVSESAIVILPKEMEI